MTGRVWALTALVLTGAGAVSACGDDEPVGPVVAVRETPPAAPPSIPTSIPSLPDPEALPPGEHFTLALSAAPDVTKATLTTDSGRVLGEWRLPGTPSAEDFAPVAAAVPSESARVSIAADRDARHAVVVSAMDALRERGIRGLSLAVQAEAAPPPPG